MVFDFKNYSINMPTFFSSCSSIAPASGYNFPAIQLPLSGADFWTNLQEQCSIWRHNIIQQCSKFSSSQMTFKYDYNIPLVNYSMPVVKYGFPRYNYSTSVSTHSGSGGKSKATGKSSQKSSYVYANLSKSEAYKKASQDPNLVDISNGGDGFSISKKSFINDITFINKEQVPVLTALAKAVGQELVLTSALGTASSPHCKNGSHTHYSMYPKVDVRGDAKLAQKLNATGLVEATFENDHIDMYIKDNAYEKLHTRGFSATA